MAGGEAGHKARPTMSMRNSRCTLTTTVVPRGKYRKPGEHSSMTYSGDSDKLGLCLTSLHSYATQLTTEMSFGSARRVFSALRERLLRHDMEPSTRQSIPLSTLQSVYSKYFRETATVFLRS